MGATGVRYIQMGQASHVQDNNTWDIEETAGRTNLTTDFKTIATETTNDEKLSKFLICLERRSIIQIPEEYSHY